MPKANVNHIQIEYETFGASSAKPLLLIMGLGSQMILWDEEFCEQLVSRGFYVIRFDNRDVGLSTKFEETGIPNLKWILLKRRLGIKSKPPYSLEDMADDAVGLLDALKIDKAHICGASMGAYIAQIVAFRHPSRVLSLISIMGSTGNPKLPKADPKAMKLLFSKMPTSREAYVEATVKGMRVLYGSKFPFDEVRARKSAEASYDRCFYPEGMLRQLAATLTNGNRKPKLSAIKVPTLVIHGAEDELIPVECGKDTAEAIPNARLLIIEGMGHNIPPEVMPQILEAITGIAHRSIAK